MKTKPSLATKKPRVADSASGEKAKPPLAVTNEGAERRIELPRSLTVKQLADRLGLSGVEVIKDLMKNGIMASINQVIDYDTAAIVAADFGYEAYEESAPAAEVVTGGVRYRGFGDEDPAALRPRKMPE